MVEGVGPSTGSLRGKRAVLRTELEFTTVNIDATESSVRSITQGFGHRATVGAETWSREVCQVLIPFSAHSFLDQISRAHSSRASPGDWAMARQGIDSGLV
jgi:hypothetical protein